MLLVQTFIEMQVYQYTHYLFQIDTAYKHFWNDLGTK